MTGGARLARHHLGGHCVGVVRWVGCRDRQAWVGGLSEGANRGRGLSESSLSMDQAELRGGSGQSAVVRCHLGHSLGVGKGHSMAASGR
jgi:hypothetical protein